MINKILNTSNIIESTGSSKNSPLLSVTSLSSKDLLSKVPSWFSSGLYPLDLAIGGGAGTYPVRKIIEIYGDYSTGKTLLALLAAAKAQQAGGFVVYADTEVALDPTWATSVGVDADNLIVCHPNTVGEVFKVLDEFIDLKNKEFSVETPMLFIWDSVASVATMGELSDTEADGYEKKGYPDAARIISKAFRGNVRKYAVNNVCILLINQIRSNISANPWDIEVPTYGGMAISFYAAVRMFLKRGRAIKNGKETVGNWIRIKSLKNKVYQPFREVALPMYYDGGISTDEAVFELCLEKDVVIKSGGPYYKLNDDLFEDKVDRQTFMKKNFGPALEEHKITIYDALERLS